MKAGRGQRPWLRRRHELGASRPTRLQPGIGRAATRPYQRPGTARKKCAKSRNEPILFSINYQWNDFIYRNLCRLQTRLQMGSFWKNEAIFWGMRVSGKALTLWRGGSL